MIGVMKVTHISCLRVGCILYSIDLFLKADLLILLCIVRFVSNNSLLVEWLDSYSEIALWCSVCKSCCEAYS